MTTHQLTDEQRRLLEDCPREKVRQAVGNIGNWFDICEFADDDLYINPYSLKRAAYIPRAAVEAWLAEQADHLRDATKMVHDDQSGEPNELTQSKDAGDMQDKGPWRVNKDQDTFQLWSHNINGQVLAAWVVHPEAYTEPEARAIAEAEAARLNAKHREEQAAREAEAEKQRRIAAFVERYKSKPLNWFWSAESDDRQYWIDTNGGSFSRQKVFGDASRRMLIPRAELEAALRAAGVEEPVTISEERRAELEARRRYLSRKCEQYTQSDAVFYKAWLAEIDAELEGSDG